MDPAPDSTQAAPTGADSGQSTLEPQTSSSTEEPSSPSVSPVVPSQGNVVNPEEGQQAEGSPASAEPSPAQQEVPEQRPIGSVQPSPHAASDTSKRYAANDPGPHGEAEYAAAQPTPENEAAAADASRTPHLIVGQRVQFVKGDETGRMALIQQVIYKDPIQQMIANSGSAEARFAEVSGYVVLTRDGRSDTLLAQPDEVRSLEGNNGWGRGTI